MSKWTFSDNSFVANNFWTIYIGVSLLVPSCFSRQDESTHVPGDIERSYSNIAMRSRSRRSRLWPKWSCKYQYYAPLLSHRGRKNGGRASETPTRAKGLRQASATSDWRTGSGPRLPYVRPTTGIGKLHCIPARGAFKNRKWYLKNGRCKHCKNIPCHIHFTRLARFYTFSNLHALTT